MTIAIPSLILSGLLGVVLAYFGYGVWSLVWMSVFQAFLNNSSIVDQVHDGFLPFIFNKAKFRYHFKFGYKLTLSGLLDTIFNNIYQIIIGRYFLLQKLAFLPVLIH